MTQCGSQLRQQFEDCVDSCADSIYRVAFRLTANPTLARELVQETYLNAWRSLPSLEDPGRMRAWMFAILRNQYSKLMRHESKSVTTQAAMEHLPDQESRSDETTDEVQFALNKLDDNHKLPLLLVTMEGMSVAEAASVLGLPRGTVLSRLSRGREKLKQILSRQNSIPESKLRSPH